jgi:hypothetical protein
MFHTRKATVALDKVYALLGMTCDDPSAAGLLADYSASWETVFRKLVTFSLSTRMSVETWDGKEVGVISGKGCVLGEVSVVEGGTITWKDISEGRSQSFTPQHQQNPSNHGMSSASFNGHHGLQSLGCTAITRLLSGLRFPLWTIQTLQIPSGQNV